MQALKFLQQYTSFNKLLDNVSNIKSRELVKKIENGEYSKHRGKRQRGKFQEDSYATCYFDWNTRRKSSKMTPSGKE